MAKLNPNAPEFVPCHSLSAEGDFHFDFGYNCAADPAYEENVSSGELEELEACEEWVRTMAELEEMERDHIIATALAEAEPSQILAVEMRAMALEPSQEPAKHKTDGKRRVSKH